ncbi:MAG TPA: hypothetical protein VFZ53_23770 [Polyangiaceae bacterium]
MGTAAIEKYAELSKTELLERYAGLKTRATNMLGKHRETIKHVGFTFMGQGASAVTGGMYALVERKAPSLLTVPRTKVPTATVAALALSGLNCARVFGDATPIVQSIADGAQALGARELALKLVLK